ncbi:low quality protein: putative nuclease harbi1 [Plakobranchus ocellatus]|uniref:Low quality protein: putative nuclease harbi1 n=1 Tax=Plakobranchus ocellatus TaxID=259542 RepID=A0AAV4B7L5_9GAST|nr:low quality protein: putative nuclease harbi1 [Plakobranchus ocellatus]
MILGDSGYMIRQWLLTPYANPHTEAQERFNLAHASTRSTIERCIALTNKRVTSRILQRVATDCAAKDESVSDYVTEIPQDRDDGTRKRKCAGVPCLLVS